MVMRITFEITILVYTFSAEFTNDLIDNGQKYGFVPTVLNINPDLINNCQTRKVNREIPFRIAYAAI